MDEAMLTLKPCVTLTEAGNRVGLVHNGQTQFAKNKPQVEIMRALVLKSRSPESLTALLHSGESLLSDDENSLAIAEFILDFGEFLEA